MEVSIEITEITKLQNNPTLNKLQQLLGKPTKCCFICLYIFDARFIIHLFILINLLVYFTRYLIIDGGKDYIGLSPSNITLQNWASKQDF